MTSSKVLLVDDNIGDLGWLVDFLTHRGLEIDLALNEKQARTALEAVRDGRAQYRFAIFDIMVATVSIEDLIQEELNQEGLSPLRDRVDQVVENSLNTGVRLCEYARIGLGLGEERLPIFAISVRQDKELAKALKRVGVKLYSRAPSHDRPDIRAHLERTLTSGNEAVRRRSPARTKSQRARHRPG